MLRKIRKLLKVLKPKKTKSRYLNFTIHHHKNDGLINEIRKSNLGLYEEEETLMLINILKNVDQPVMLDIGANIGLMTLNACAQIKNVVIYAFEPGPIQFGYLKQNIDVNGLNNQVSIFNVALSSVKGLIDFHMHTDIHSSGDGIMDTGRAGKSTVIQVKSITLDEWWDDQGQPTIRLIKIDTEGAELQILQNATNLIQKNRPSILIEMCDLNFKKYGLTYQNHLDFFYSLKYDIFDTKLKKKVQGITDIAPYQYYYLAVPHETYKLF